MERDLKEREVEGKIIGQIIQRPQRAGTVSIEIKISSKAAERHLNDRKQID